MQDAQDDRSQICFNYVTKGPNVIANISRKFYCCFLYIVRYMILKSKNKRLIKLKIPFSFQTLCEHYMRGSNGGTAGPDPRPSILNCALCLSHPDLQLDTLSPPPPPLIHISGSRFILLQISTLVCTMRHRLKPSCQNMNYNRTGSSEFTLKSLLPVNCFSTGH